MPALWLFIGLMEPSAWQADQKKGNVGWRLGLSSEPAGEAPQVVGGVNLG